MVLSFTAFEMIGIDLQSQLQFSLESLVYIYLEFYLACSIFGQLPETIATRDERARSENAKRDDGDISLNTIDITSFRNFESWPPRGGDYVRPK